MKQRKNSFILGTINTFSGATRDGSRSSLALKLSDSDPLNFKESSISRTDGTTISPSQRRQVEQAMGKGKGKTKLIKKVGKVRRVEKIEEKKQKQEIRFKYLRRKISPLQKSVGGNPSKFQILHVFDWQMEAVKNLYLSKDAFYMATAMAQDFFNSPSRLASENMVNLSAMAIVSIAAKFESSALNYTSVLSGMCGTSQEELGAAEINVTRAIKFAFPVLSVYSEIVQMCRLWHGFVVKSRPSLQIDPSLLQLGSSPMISEWPAASQNKIQDIFYFFDAIILRSPQLFQIKNRQHVQTAASFALFTVMYHLTREFFPSTPSDKTYLVHIFHAFLSYSFGYSALDNQSWLSYLICVKNKLNLVENVHHYFMKKMSSDKMKQESLGQENTQHNTMALSKREQSQFFKQQYHLGLSRWH